MFANRNRQRVTIAILLLVLAFIAVIILYYLPQWQAVAYVRQTSRNGQLTLELDRAYFDVENEARKTLAQIILGVFGLGALYLTWIRSKAADRQASVQEQSHLTDRFTAAIDQLGATRDKDTPNVEVRLGGIYALEQLAMESVTYHSPIVEVLCAYVRENAPSRIERNDHEKDTETWHVELDAETADAAAASSASSGSSKAGRAVKPRSDVQAAITVLGRRSRVTGREIKNFRLDLSRVDLRGASFSHGHYEGARFLHSDLRGAWFDQSHLSYAELIGANAEGASFAGADLSDASLNGCAFRDAQLIGTVFRDCQMDLADLTNACLLDADCTTITLVRDVEVLQRNALTEEQVKCAAMWDRARWSPQAAAKLGLSSPPR